MTIDLNEKAKGESPRKNYVSADHYRYRINIRLFLGERTLNLLTLIREKYVC